MVKMRCSAFGTCSVCRKGGRAKMKTGKENNWVSAQNKSVPSWAKATGDSGIGVEANQLPFCFLILK